MSFWPFLSLKMMVTDNLILHQVEGYQGSDAFQDGFFHMAIAR